MNLKDFIRLQIRNFFMITALVNIAIFILGTVYRNGALFSYDAFLAPPLYGLFGTLPSWVMYSKNELTMKQVIVRKGIQVLLLEILLGTVTFWKNEISSESIPVILSFALSVLVIYILVMVIGWFIDKRDAQNMMNDLALYQQMNEE